MVVPPQRRGLGGRYLATGWTTRLFYPKLWTWPPVRGIAHLVERLSLVPLVAGSPID
jgi:hypothetical protein